MSDIDDSDFKLYRNMLPLWQESYMKKLISEYQELLSSDDDASKKFWELERRINTDKRFTGVASSVSKSDMIFKLLDLLNSDVITTNDLSIFSDELRKRIELFRNIEF